MPSMSPSTEPLVTDKIPYQESPLSPEWTHAITPTQFKLDIHLQMYQETDGFLAYLKGHTVRKLVSPMKYMSLLISQDRPDAQKHNPLYFISGNQLFKLTAHDMKSALVNENLEIMDLRNTHLRESKW